jgi:rhodanese-related sulfurtransferase
MKHGATPEELRQWLDAGRNLTILDVRKKADYEADSAMLRQAQWMDPERVVEWSANLPEGVPVVVYCVHGHAVSQGVADHLRANGFDASLLEGGIEAWKEIGGPTVQKRVRA